jgi:hypothetical protein
MDVPPCVETVSAKDSANRAVQIVADTLRRPSVGTLLPPEFVAWIVPE